MNNPINSVSLKRHWYQVWNLLEQLMHMSVRGIVWLLEAGQEVSPRDHLLRRCYQWDTDILQLSVKIFIWWSQKEINIFDGSQKPLDTRQLFPSPKSVWPPSPTNRELPLLGRKPIFNRNRIRFGKQLKNKKKIHLSESGSSTRSITSSTTSSISWFDSTFTWNQKSEFYFEWKL